MKKTYKTTFAIEAEQFDGSYEMAKEYEMVQSVTGTYHMYAFNGLVEVSEGDWLISNGENIAVIDDEHFKEQYELVEDDDDPIDKLTKVIEKREAQQFDPAVHIAKLALEVAGVNKKLEQIHETLRTQEIIRQQEVAAKSRAYSNYIDELTESTDVLKNNKLM